ncbi:hypothetical protein MMC12_008136 [Toensbergia leucococca]|nr:hypothetical protein [Toensbergia leucococca]
MPTRRCPHCDLYFAGTAVLDLHVRNVHGPEESTMEALPSRGYLGTLAAARRYDDDGDENSEPPPTHDQPSRTIVDPNYWDNTYPRPPLSMESMMGSFAIEPVNGRNIGPSQRVGPGDPTVQPPREYTVVFEARDVNQRMQFASNTPFQAFLQRLEMVSASVASTISGRSTGFTLADGPWWYSLVNRQHVKETVRKPLTSMLFYQAMVSELLRVPTPWILAVVSHELQTSRVVAGESIPQPQARPAAGIQFNTSASTQVGTPVQQSSEFADTPPATVNFGGNFPDSHSTPSAGTPTNS